MRWHVGGCSRVSAFTSSRVRSSSASRAASRSSNASTRFAPRSRASNCANAHRLAQEIVHAGGKRIQQVLRGIAGGNHDKVGIAIRRNRAHRTGHAQAVEAGHIPIEQDDARRVCAQEDVERVLAISDQFDLVTVPLEKGSEGASGNWIVFRYEHAHCGRRQIGIAHHL